MGNIDLVRRRLSMLGVAAIILAACSGGTTPSPGKSGAPSAAAGTPVASIAGPPGAAVTPNTQATPGGEATPGESSGAPEPTTEAGSPEPTVYVPPSTPPGGLRWYCCLGTGQDAGQVEFENKVAADFTAANPDTPLIFEVVTYDSAYDQLATEIGGANPPDFAGPVGVSGIESFHGQWKDLTPLIQSSGFDLSVYDPKLVEFYKTDEGQVGVPFDVYPSMLWYSRPAFDEAGLNYPPHKYGEKYTMPDGSQVDWNYDTIREIGKMLTVDTSGNDASQPGFDPDNIDQWGFDPQRDDLRYVGGFWSPGSLVGADGTTVTIPDAWKAAWKYFYDGMWNEHFIPTGPQFDTVAAPAGGYAFFSGKVAMATNYLWTTYGLGEDSAIAGDWDVAAMPSYNGQLVSPINADTFGVLKASRNPDAAFKAVSYLVKDRAQELLSPDIYGGMPARTSEQAAYVDSLKGNFANVDWQVLTDSLEYPDVPNTESFMPKYSQSVTILRTYLSKWTTTPGLDLDAEITALQNELQTAWNQ
jgi:multiple sugar transport system substrate-binding protein